MTPSQNNNNFSSCSSSTSTTSTPSSSYSRLANLPSPSYKRLYLIRHGETDWNQQGLMQGGGYDIPLNEQGQHQAERAARALSTASPHLQVIASSHLQRASQTADCIAQAFETAGAVAQTTRPVRVIHHHFGEMRFGKWEGTQSRNNPEFQALNLQIQKHKDVQWPGGGESTKQVEERALKGLQLLLHRDFSHCTHVGVVAHGRFNRILLQCLLQSSEPLPRQSNAAISVLDVDPNGQWTPLLINYVEHLR